MKFVFVLQTNLQKYKGQLNFKEDDMRPYHALKHKVCNNIYRPTKHSLPLCKLAKLFFSGKWDDFVYLKKIVFSF